MTEVALNPAEMDLTLKKLGLTPKKLGSRGSMTPKFQSLNRALCKLRYIMELSE